MNNSLYVGVERGGRGVRRGVRRGILTVGQIKRQMRLIVHREKKKTQLTDHRFFLDFGLCVFVYVCLCHWLCEKDREREREREGCVCVGGGVNR